MPCVICDAWVEYGDIIWERLPYGDTWQVTPDVFLKGYHRGEDLWLAYCPACWRTRQATVRFVDTQSLPRQERDWGEVTLCGDDVGFALGED
jgi:hypothetical protein